MKEDNRILVVDDEKNMRRILKVSLDREGYDVVTASNGYEAYEKMLINPAQVVITDLKMPKMDGMALLKQINQSFPDVPVIMITAHGTVENAVEAMKRGAFDYISKPFEMNELRMILSKAVNAYELNRIEIHSGGTEFEGGIVGVSSQLKNILIMAKKIAASPTTVLITGESGTGKELVAHLIHNLSTRKDQPFIKVNCAAIPESLIESEFFGYEKGAFTGAVNSKPGRFELADKGSIFLDEIGEISREMQVKMLRVLQEKKFERVGGLNTIQVDVRLIVATNRDLDKAVEQGEFREDLFYRLNVIPIHIPPLRERREDIPPLIDHYIQHFNNKLDRNITGISQKAMEQIYQYPWPGNVRELENTLERAILLSGNQELDQDDFSTLLTGKQRAQRQLSKTHSFKEVVQQETEKVEFELLKSALNETEGNVTQAAKLLGLSRKGLQIKMKKHGLKSGK